MIGATFAALADLVEEARRDPAAAWSKFAAFRDRAKEVNDELGLIVDEVERLGGDGCHQEAAALAETSIERAREVGLAMTFCLLHAMRGKALLASHTGDRAENIEHALESFGAALDTAHAGDLAVDLLMHAAIANAERLRDDVAENLEVGLKLMGLAQEELSDESPPELQAIVYTNTATLLLRRQRGDRAENLRAAADMCQRALEHRSPERDAVDWAYTELNLGEVLQNLAALGEGTMDAADKAYARVIAEGDLVAERWLVGAAHYSRGRIKRALTERSAADVVDAFEVGEEIEEEDSGPLLREAKADFLAARELMRGAPDLMMFGRLLNDLAYVQGELEETDDAIASAKEACSILRVDTAPRESAGANAQLGAFLADRGAWDDAADAYASAVEAAEFNVRARLDTSDRQREVRDRGNLYRWAAFALARAGRPTEAAAVLERGRARELGRRLGLRVPADEGLAGIPDELRDAYLRAANRLSSAGLGTSGHAAGRELQEVVAAIAEWPGYESFGTTNPAQSLVGAVEPGWPLVFVNPTPAGTLLLRLAASDAGVESRSLFLDQPIALDVWARLSLGDGADLLGSDEFENHHDDYASYALAVGSFAQESEPEGGTQDAAYLERAIDQALPWIGEKVARPLSEFIAEVEAVGVSLVPCGPIGLAALHASNWTDNDRSRCLLDLLPVRYMPSAAFGAAALRRSASHKGQLRYLVALGDPEGNLQAAEPEVEDIKRHFAPNRADVAFKTNADSVFLRRRASRATHLHFACHGSGSITDAVDSGLGLADGNLPALQVPEVLQLNARLVVVSACQTAVSAWGETPDEYFSIGTAMLAAGSASAVATLWPVHDAATALLMGRFYDEMFDSGARPPEALRTAQLWLRDLTDDGEDAFLAQHPALRDEFRRRAQAADLPGRRNRDGKEQAATGLYAHPKYWAPFLVFGA